MGNTDMESFPVGEDAFVADHLRGVADNIFADLRNIGCLPDKLQSGQAGVQVAWALIAKTLPPRVVHLLRAHPVSETAELTEMLQEGLQDAVRQLMGVPYTTADQLRVARLPVSVGGLGVPHLPSLAVIARCSALATMPRASDTARYRQTLIDLSLLTSFAVSETFVIVTLPPLLATWWIRPWGSASDTLVANFLTPATLRLSMLCGFVVLSSLSLSAMLGCATYLVTTRPGQRPIMDKAIGCSPCQASGPPPCLTQRSSGDSNKGLASLPQGQVNLVGAYPPGASAATIYLTLWADMPGCATKAFTQSDTIACMTTLLLWPARRDSLCRWSRTCLSQVLGRWRACPGQCQTHSQSGPAHH